MSHMSASRAQTLTFTDTHTPVSGDVMFPFGVLPSSVPIVVSLSVLVRDVCESLLVNPSWVTK